MVRGSLSCRQCQRSCLPHASGDGLCGSCRQSPRRTPRSPQLGANDHSPLQAPDDAPVRGALDDDGWRPTPRPHVPRHCLKCDRRFLSWGAANRLCPTCREHGPGGESPGLVYTLARVDRRPDDG
jgi:hypothetical protein